MIRKSPPTALGAALSFRRGLGTSRPKAAQRRDTTSCPDRVAETAETALAAPTRPVRHDKDAERAVIATALNIVKTRPLTDLYVRRDYTGEFRIRVQLESGQRYVITIKEE